MNQGHSMNGVYATGGTIHPGDTPVVVEHPAPYVMPHPLGAAPAHAAFPAASPIPVPAPTTHALPSGHTVTVASARILTRGQRRQLVEMVRSAPDGRTGGIATSNALIEWLVTDWTYLFPIPSADDTALDSIPAEDDDALIDLIVPPANRLLFPKPPTPDDHEDEQSPTAPSGE